jgi:hypothetical protein
MKISILVGQNGEVLATVRQPVPGAPGSPTLPQFGLIPSQGQTLREIELPPALETIQSAEELHQALKVELSKPS